MTTAFLKKGLSKRIYRSLKSLPFIQLAYNHIIPTLCWLRPNGKNLNHLLTIVREAAYREKSYLQFMLHSPELMPGGSPKFQTERDINQLYDHLEILFQNVSAHFTGATLKEFYQTFSNRGN